jgi:hypothetical protein
MCYSCTIATCLELLNHFVLWQATVSMLKICAVLTQSYNPPARTSHQHLMGRLLHAL